MQLPLWAILFIAAGFSMIDLVAMRISGITFSAVDPFVRNWCFVAATWIWWMVFGK